MAAHVRIAGWYALYKWLRVSICLPYCGSQWDALYKGLPYMHVRTAPPRLVARPNRICQTCPPQAHFIVCMFLFDAFLTYVLIVKCALLADLAVDSRERNQLNLFSASNRHA